MADAWDEYIKRQQDRPSSGSSNPWAGIPIFGGLLGRGGIKPDTRGMYTPSMGDMPVGPPSPINYSGIRALLNSGVLRTGQVAPPPQPTPAPPPVEPDAPVHPLARLFKLLAGGMKP